MRRLPGILTGAGVMSLLLSSTEGWITTTAILTRSRVITGIDTGDNDGDPLDDLPYNDPNSFAGHGTLIAGVVGAITNNNTDVAGVMWNCKIMPVKMVRSGGVKFPFIQDWNFDISVFPSDAANAMDYAVNNGAHVINLSYGFPDMGWTIGEVIFKLPMLFQALDNAYKHNVVITVSMGNEFQEGNPINYPAAFQEQVIAVGASDQAAQRASFSSTGPHISVVAPGVSIFTTVRGGGSAPVSGTSFSSPLTAGVAGLVISQGLDRGFGLTNNDVKHILELTAVDITTTGVGFDAETGFGIVNARNALQLLNSPNVLIHGTSTGGASTQLQTISQWILLDGRWGLAAASYASVDQYKVTKHVNFAFPFCAVPRVWMRERESISLSYGNPNSGKPFSIISNISTTGFDLEYVTYFVHFNSIGQAVNAWVPAAPASTLVAYTAVGQQNLAAQAGPITGPTSICTSGNFAVSNLGRSTITWSSNIPTLLAINATSGVATRQNNGTGQVTITATVSNSGCTNALTQTVWVGPPILTNWKIDGLSTSQAQVCPGGHTLTVTPTGANAGNAAWIVPPGIQYSVGMNNLGVNLPPNMPSSINIVASSSNSCGAGPSLTFTLIKKTSGCPGSFAILVSPNPVEEELSVQLVSANSEAAFVQESPVIEEVILFNGNQNIVRSSDVSGDKTKLNVRGLTKGQYTLQVRTGTEIYTNHVLIK